MFSYETSRFFHNSLEHLYNPHVCLLQAGWEKCNAKHQYSNYRNFYLVHFVRSGKGTLQIGEHTYTLGANDVFLIRPNQLAIYTADEANPWEYYYFAFSGSMAPELIERSCFRNNRTVSTTKDDTLYSLIRDAALSISNCDDAPDLLGLEYLFKIMRILEQNQPTETKSDSIACAPVPSEQCFSAVQEYLQFNFSKAISVADICKNLSISRSYLFRIFKKHTNSSVEAYLLSLRIQHAKHLLSTTDFSTACIARLVGYPNPTSFYRMFKRIEQVTPSQWRTQHRELISQNPNGTLQEHSPD